jgi:hypothetical protein
MKNLVLSLLFLFATNAMANSFDSFVGEYTVVGKPSITKSGNVKECLRFGFQYLTGLSVISDSKGYNQSHVLHFNFNGGSIGHGWSGFPVMDFNYKNDFGNGGSYAKTTGDANKAVSEYTAWGRSSDVNDSTPLIVSIQKNGNQFVLNVSESYIRNSVTVSNCSYVANLSK